jgi:hypothetical protein
MYLRCVFLLVLASASLPRAYRPAGASLLLLLGQSAERAIAVNPGYTSITPAESLRLQVLGQ